MLPFRSRVFAVAPCLLAFTLSAAFQQGSVPLAAVDDTLLHAEIAQLGVYPELEGGFSSAVLQEVPLRSCSPWHAELSDGSVRVRIEATGTMGHTVISALQVVLDDSLLFIPVEAYAGLKAPLFCAYDTSLHRILPYCSVSRSLDGYRTYVHLQLGEGRELHLVTWVFDEAQYLFRVEEKAVL